MANIVTELGTVSTCQCFFMSGDVKCLSKMRKDIWNELRLNECKNCRTRSEPVLSPEPEVCPLCGWIMINITFAEFSKVNPIASEPRK